jgi:type IV pilus assembly protein PilY1
MNDYCIVPPFVIAGVKPNLMLMLDNSGSMFDLTYIDKGSATREPYYCYDKTYNFGYYYSGYFDDPAALNPTAPSWYVYYEYDFVNNYFYKVPAPTWTGCDLYVSGTLCINGTNLTNTTTPKTLTKFVAEGNYLNWLTASKFDVQKLILTGGKYDLPSNNLMLETRGCVGRRFIKEPIVNQSYVEGGTNTGLGITFAVKGPDHPYSQTLVSPGGQTYLEIYAGNYTESNCQQAVTDIINEENKNTITNDIELCLNYDAHGQYCSLDMFTSCDDDADCAGTPGFCSIINDGVCTAINDGTCSLTTAGVCTANNGNCIHKVCVGGGKAGAACNNANDCKISFCTAGKVGSICTANADCNLSTCTAGLIGNICVVNSDCNSKECSAPAAKVGTACALNLDCNTGAGTCTAGNVGAACTTDLNCALNYKGVCQKPVTQQIKSTFGQSLHECYQYWDDGSLTGSNWLQIITNPSGCSQIYKELYTCRGGERDTKTCVAPADCPGGSCINGPEAIRQGSPALVCGPNFTGYCAGSADNWVTTTWYDRGYPAVPGYTSVENCIKERFEAFCDGAQVPPVVDPTDDPSTTENFDNLPAIIGDMAIGAQLGDPLKILTVNKHTVTAPEGLLQDFENLIHFGAMTFDFFGSLTECPANVSCTKICSTALSTCAVDADCPSGDTCVVASNLDGAHILNLGNKEGYILGRCSTTTATTCAVDSHCPSGEYCAFSVGSHSSGLVNAIDTIFASTWTPYAEGFYNAIGYYAQRTDKRLNATDFIAETEDSAYKKPVQYKCQKNNILLITDGMSTADLNADVNAVVASYNDGDGQIDSAASATCPEFAGSRNLDDLSWLAKHKNIKDFTETPTATDPEINSKTITSYVVFNGAASTDPGECNPDTLLRETAENGCGTSSGCYQRAEDPAQLREALRQAFLQISGRAASGTAASVLASGEGSGANLLQAIFYPTRSFGTTQISWTGTLQNYWYYIDPLLNNSTIREDSASSGYLDLRNDYIMHFFFDTDKQTKVKLFSDADGNGLADSTIPVATKYVDETLDPANKLKYLWEAGTRLWLTAPSSRTLYTFDGTSRVTLPDTITAGSTLIDLMQAANANEATAIARYVKGTDLKVCSTNKNICTTVADCTVAGETCDAYRSRTVTIGGVTNVWKLGDIISSTPKLSSWIPVNTYQLIYNDNTYGPVGQIPKYSDPADTNYFITRTAYKNRETVFVGSNDGMLHAFKLGTVNLSDSKYVKAQLSGTGLGTEKWAYIPKHSLPYLKYTADPGYCHLYFVDLVPSIFDVSIGGLPAATKTADSWKTVLIGGMRYGGACSDAATSYQVQTPAAGKGYSSYFALDITDQDNPQVLWEFSNETIASLYPSDVAAGGIGGLGFATTGPALIRTGAKDKNGRWFVVFASGPTGPIDTTTHQFNGYSDQNLKLYIIDLKNGPTAGNIWRVNTGIQNAFAGSLLGSPIDLDQNNAAGAGYYQDDALYFGYTYAEENPLTANTRWTKGGVIRLVTAEDTDPTNWTWSKVIENIGPVTASVSKLQNYKAGNEALWLFFGSGRYYYKVADVIDDSDSQRTLYGIKDPCFISDPLDTYYKKIDPACSSTISGDSGISDATSAGLSSPDSWKINLDMCTNSSGTVVDCADSSVLYRTERLVTSPVSSPVGAVFFTTVKPSADVCEFGGISHLWAVKYSTGGSVPRSLLKGTALVQVSTGSIEEKELKSAFVEKVDSGTGEGRRTEGLPGQTNEGGALIPVPPKPMNKILHIRER